MLLLRNYKVQLLFTTLLPVLVFGQAPDILEKIDFYAWDKNDDGGLSQAEWRDGFETNNLFFRLDQDGNMVIGGEEVNDAGNLNYDLSWDKNQDGAIHREEALEGLFTYYEFDNDNLLEESDFQIFKGDISLELGQL